MKALIYKIRVDSRTGVRELPKEYRRKCDVIRALQMIDFTGYWGSCVVNICAYSEDRLIGVSPSVEFPRDITLREVNRTA